MTRKLTALLAGAALFALPASMAGADGAAAPTPCAGMFYTDAAGDATYLDVNADITTPANPNEDIRGFFFNYRDGVLTANIVLQNLDKTESGAKYATGSAWEVKFTGEDGENYYAKAKTDGSAWSYELEHVDRVGTGQVVDPGTYVTEPLKGSAAEGPMGVLSIEVPSTIAGVKAGGKLKGVTVTTFPRKSVQQPGFFTDDAPDTAKDYTVTECPAPVATAAAAPAAEAPAPAAPAAPAAPPAQQQSQAPAQPAPSSNAAPAAKNKKVASCSAKAKRIKNAKKRKKALKACAKKAKKK